MGEVLRVNQMHPDPRVVEHASAVLLAGGVIVMPTDSVYGLGCLAREGNPGHARIFDIKRRDRSQTLPWLVPEVEDIDRYGADVPGWARELAHRWWPGALTLVVHASREVPREYRRAGSGTIALRLPASPLAVDIMRRTGLPLANTSANTHGEAAATSGHAVEGRIVEAADLTLDSGPAPIAVASTIVGCTSDEPVILRDGAIPSEEIRAVLS